MSGYWQQRDNNQAEPDNLNFVLEHGQIIVLNYLTLKHSFYNDDSVADP